MYLVTPAEGLQMLQFLALKSKAILIQKGRTTVIFAAALLHFYWEKV